MRLPLHQIAFAVSLAFSCLPVRATTAHFEANRGQASPGVDFVARGGRQLAFLTGGHAVFVIQAHPGSDPARVRMTLLGAESRAGVGQAPLSGRVHYLRSRSAESWIRDVPLFAEIRYPAVYPGIDLTYRWADGRIEYDFTVAPGAEPGRVRLEFDGAQRISMDPEGNLVLETPAGELVQRAPLLYQWRNGERERVPGRFELDGQSARFSVGDHDRTRPLVIDPLVEFASYLGGSGDDHIADVAVDASGAVYVAGTTHSLDFPVAGVPPQGACGLQTAFCRDAFVAKLDPSASGDSVLVWATYLGGIDDDSAMGLAIDAQGSAYVVGRTRSTNFPTTPGSFQPACQLSPYGTCGAGFISKLTPDGSAFAYSSYLSGGYNHETSTAALEEAQGVAVDADGAAYVVGTTHSRHFPVTPDAFQPSFGGASDAFVVKLDPPGSTALYASYLGGSGSEEYVKVAIDPGGNAYVAGRTNSTDFPTLAALQPTMRGGDGFLAKVNPLGTELVYSTYLGGGQWDACIGVAVDGSGNAVVTGQTQSVDFPLVAAFAGPNGGSDGYGDAFVTKVNAAGDEMVFSTYLGGFEEDWGTDVAVDPEGNVYVTGETVSWDFPVLHPIQPFAGEGAFVSKFNPAGALRFSTFVGASWAGGWGPAVEVDPAGRIVVGDEASNRFLPLVRAYQAFGGGSFDGYVSVIDPRPPAPSIAGFSPARGAPGTPVAIAGSAFTEATQVRFNGTQASFVLHTDTSLTATVPEGSSSGPILVATPSGSAFSEQSFTVQHPPSLSISDASTSEGNRSERVLSFRLTLSKAATQRVTVHYQTADGTATVTGSDYLEASGTVSFPVGAVSRVITTTVKGDWDLEANENFFVNLSSPVNAVIVDAQGVGTLLNDDPAPPTISIGDDSVLEGSALKAGRLRFTVRLSAASNTTVSVAYRTVAGSASAGTDYREASGTLLFSPGTVQKTIPVRLVGDGTAEGDENILVELSNASRAVIADGSGVGTIIDDDRP